MKILNIYTVSFHGSGLWDLFSSDCGRLYKAWNVAVRHVWNVPNTTHRYLIETISGCLHPKVMLASCCCGFVKSLLSIPKYPVRVLASLCSSDQRTVMGRCLRSARSVTLEERTWASSLLWPWRRWWSTSQYQILKAGGLASSVSWCQMILRFQVSQSMNLKRWFPSFVYPDRWCVRAVFPLGWPKFFPLLQESSTYYSCTYFVNHSVRNKLSDLSFFSS